MTQEEINAFFAARETDAEAIEAAGWKVYSSSSGDWWWERYEKVGDSMRFTCDRYFRPKWVYEIERDRFDAGVSSVRTAIRDALGIAPPRQKKGKP